MDRHLPALACACCLAFALTACSAEQTDLTVTPPVPGGNARSPAQSLKAAVPTADDGPYHYRLSFGTRTVTGVVDVADRAMTVQASAPIPNTAATVDTTVLTVGDRTWLKVRLSAGVDLPAKWMLTDVAGSDPPAGPLAQFFAHASQVREDPPGHFTGVTDLTSVPDNGFVDITGLGTAAAAITFDATATDQRLTSVTTTAPAAGGKPATAYRMTLSGFGITAGLQAPAPADQVAMPAVARRFISAAGR